MSTQSRITAAELGELFGDTLPIAAVTLLLDPGGLSIDDLRKRLRVLAGQTPRTVWTAGWNMPGYLPEDDPQHFDTWADAATYLRWELSKVLDEAIEQSTAEHTPPEVAQAADIINHIAASAPDQRVSERVGRYVYWIERVEVTAG